MLSRKSEMESISMPENFSDDMGDNDMGDKDKDLGKSKKSQEEHN